MGKEEKKKMEQKDELTNSGKLTNIHNYIADYQCKI